MILSLYIVISYLVMLGMIAETYESNSQTPGEAWLCWLFSPFVLPILIGMSLAETKKKK